MYNSCKIVFDTLNKVKNSIPVESNMFRMLAILFTALASVLVIPLHTTSNSARAHEVRPAIADVDVKDTSLNIIIRLSAEALVAGLDLKDIQDTDESPKSDEYDRLRELPPQQMAQALRDKWPEIAASFVAMAGSRPLVLDLGDVRVEPVGDVALPRESEVTLSAQLPNDGTAITLGWKPENGPLVVRHMNAGTDAYTGYLTGGNLSAPLPRSGTVAQSAGSVFLQYVVIGFEHIIPKGLDHILFVLGLFFFSLKLRPLLFQITAFTLAHTITLALATLGLVTISPSIVEPLIAASIIYVAVENILGIGMNIWRTLVVFLFGLLHGLGFASVLGDIGLGSGHFVTGLIGFNIGVELGQLAVICLAFVLVGLPFGSRTWYNNRIATTASCLIAVVASYWFLERTVL